MYLPVLKTNFNGLHLNFDSNNPILLVNILFTSISSNSHGGAIYVSSIVLNVSLFLCTFDKCCSTGSGSHGGGYCSILSNKQILHSCCFYKCQAFRCPGYILWYSTSSSMKTFFSDVNLSNEYNPDLTGAASACYSIQQSNYYQNNVSCSNTNDVASGIYIGTSQSCNIGGYSNFFNNTGPYFFGSWALSSNSISELLNLNFIECKYNNPISFFHFGAISNLKLIQNIFIKCISCKMVSGQSIGTCSITFENCFFDYIYISNNFIDCITINCIFNISQTLNSFLILDTNQCWIISSNYFTSKFDKVSFKKIILPLFLQIIYY